MNTRFNPSPSPAPLTPILAVMVATGCIVEEAPVPAGGDGVSVTKTNDDAVVALDTRIVPVVPNCTPGDFVQRTASGWSCASELVTWRTLQGIPPEIADGDDLGVTVETDPTVNALARAPLACADGAIAKASGSSWICAADDRGLTAETDPSLALTTPGSVPRFDGTQLVDSSISDDGSRVSIAAELEPDSIALRETTIDLLDAIDVETTTATTSVTTIAAWSYLGPPSSRMATLRVTIRARTSAAGEPAVFELRSLGFGTGAATGLETLDAEARLLGVLSVTGDAFQTYEITAGPLALRANEGTRFIVRWRASAGATAAVDDLVFEIRDTTIGF